MGRLLARNPTGKLRVDYTSTPVGTGTWVELSSAIPASCTAVEIFHSNGATLKLSTGSAGNEDASELKFYVLPGGTDGLIAVEFSKGVRLSAKSIQGTCDTGELVVNFYG